MSRRFDVVVVGGGPAGSSTAWKAASRGASVLVCDKAVFPRDKPCGDGLTPRAVHWLDKMGIGDEVARRFHRIDTVRLFGAHRVYERPWPQREFGFPEHGFVAPRTELDQLLLEHAESQGAEVWQGRGAAGPIVENGVVRGVRLSDGEEVRAGVTVAADGMSSRIGRALGMRPLPDRPFALAVRAQVECDRADDAILEAYLTLRDGKALLPGYGWVFPMGHGRINVGIGYVSTYRRWRELNLNQVMGEFIATLPRDWNLAPIEELRRQGRLNGWRLPMGLAVWPPWRPGVVAVGDAAGMVKPFTGVGISKALEAGVLAADAAIDALDSGGPEDLSSYARSVEETWGPYYRVGNKFLELLGHPHFMSGFVNSTMRIRAARDFVPRLLSNLYHETGGDAGDAAMRTILRFARRRPPDDAPPAVTADARAGANGKRGTRPAQLADLDRVDSGSTD